MPRVGMLNLRVTDLDRSERFYREAFGLAAPRVYNARERLFTLDPAGTRIELELTETPQRKQATKALPQIDPRVVAACKERNPNFGKGGRAKSRPSVQPTTKPSST